MLPSVGLRLYYPKCSFKKVRRRVRKVNPTPETIQPAGSAATTLSKVFFLSLWFLITLSYVIQIDFVLASLLKATQPTFKNRRPYGMAVRQGGKEEEKKNFQRWVDCPSQSNEF